MTDSLPAYTPTPAEAEALVRHAERVKRRRKFPVFKTSSRADEPGVIQIIANHPDEPTAVAVQMDALGLGSQHEFASIMRGIANITAVKGQANANDMTEALALVVGLEPRDTLQAMLATQMAAVHLATIEAASRLQRSNSEPQVLAVTTKALHTLARTFAAQAETMKKLKSRGGQKVTVEHKHYHLAPGAISGDAQAVLGDVKGGGVQSEKEQQPDVRFSRSEAVLGDLEADGQTMPWPGSDRVERLPVSRGSGRRSIRAA